MPHQIAGGGVAGGVGISEEQIHLASGLRVANLTVISRDQISVVSGGTAPLGNSAGTETPAWTTPVWAGTFVGRMPVPMTPMIAMTAPTPLVTKRVRVRVSGLDQFWSPQQETTPFVAHSATLDVTQFPLSKVFSYVSKLEFQTEIYDSDTDTISIGIGNMFDPLDVANNAQDAANARALVNLENLGFGTPIRIAPFGVSQPTVHPEILGNIIANNLRADTFAHIQPLGTVSGFTVGISAAGFEGYAHKIGFDSPDAWVTKILDLAGAEFVMGGEIEGAASTPPRASDTIKYFMTIHSSRGTRREANAESIYPRDIS